MACVGSEDAARHLTALWNLDWGHYPNATQIPPANLTLGIAVIRDLITQVRPRIIVMLTNKVADTLLGAWSAERIVMNPVESRLSYTPHEARFPQVDFPTLLIKPPNHPSRHFLTDTKISLVEEVTGRYR
jgi:hypothetical protein